MPNEKQMQTARDIYKTVSTGISSLLGLDKKDPPVLMGFIASRLEFGHVRFEIPKSIIKEGRNEHDMMDLSMRLVDLLSTACHPAIANTGWISVTDFETGQSFDLSNPDADMNSCKNNETLIMTALDELWLDPEAPHSRALLELGVGLIIVLRPSTGAWTILVDASELFASEGWVFVERDSIQEDLVMKKWHQDTYGDDLGGHPQ